MRKECNCEETEKIETIATTKKSNAGAEEVEEAEQQQNDEVLGRIDNNNNRYPECTFFKCGVGFIAWALWGHIPMLDSASVQSDLFGNGRVDSSFGRGKVGASRAEMRKLLIDPNSAPVDNRRGKKKRRSTEQKEEEQPLIVEKVPAANSKATVLEKTILDWNAESFEKETQKIAFLRARILRDRLTSRRRTEDSIRQDINRLSRSKKKPDQPLLDKLTGVYIEIASREAELDGIQNVEHRRHSAMLLD